jgi:PTS system mannose-specific IIC component
MADKAAGEGDLDRINFLHVVPPQIILFLISVIPVTLAAYYGAGAVTTILGYLDGTPLHVLQVIGGLLPALGIAMNLRSINRPNTMLFFILGFVMSIYMGLDVIVIAVLGAIIAYLYTITPRNEIGGFS